VNSGMLSATGNLNSQSFEIPCICMKCVRIRVQSLVH